MKNPGQDRVCNTSGMYNNKTHAYLFLSAFVARHEPLE